jgi:hypothetical protein
MPEREEARTADELRRHLQAALEALRTVIDERGHWPGPESVGHRLISETVGVSLEYAERLEMGLRKIGLTGFRGHQEWVAPEGDVSEQDADDVFVGRPTARQWAWAARTGLPENVAFLVVNWVRASVKPGSAWRYDADDGEPVIMEVARVHTPPHLGGEEPAPIVILRSPIRYVAALAPSGTPVGRLISAIPGGLFCAQARQGKLTLIEPSERRH